MAFSNLNLDQNTTWNEQKALNTVAHDTLFYSAYKESAPTSRTQAISRAEAGTGPGAGAAAASGAWAATGALAGAVAGWRPSIDLNESKFIIPKSYLKTFLCAVAHDVGFHAKYDAYKWHSFEMSDILKYQKSDIYLSGYTTLRNACVAVFGKGSYRQQQVLFRNIKELFPTHKVLQNSRRESGLGYPYINFLPNPYCIISPLPLRLS
jgi:hypothetical protein